MLIMQTYVSVDQEEGFKCICVEVKIGIFQKPNGYLFGLIRKGYIWPPKQLLMYNHGICKQKSKNKKKFGDGQDLAKYYNFKS